MKVIFAHDTRFIEIGDAIYSAGQFGASAWNRYLAHFDNVTVTARKAYADSNTAANFLALSSSANVAFELFPNLSTAYGLLVNRLREQRRMWQLVEGADAVIARLPSELGLLAIGCARKLGKPWAVEVVGCAWDALMHYGSFRGHLYAPLAWARMRSAVRHAPYAIYVTNRFLQERYPCQNGITAIASNVHLEAISPQSLERRLARIDNLACRPVRLGLIGTLHGRFKGIQTVIDTLANTRVFLPPVTLHVLGAGSKTPWMKLVAARGVNEIVHFEGTIPAGNPVLEWLDNIDIYLQPSLKEGLPRALIEAMSRGCPALASKTAGIPELLSSEDLVEPGSTDELGRLLLLRINDSKWMRERAQRNWETARQYEAKTLEDRRAEFWAKFALDARV